MMSLIDTRRSHETAERLYDEGRAMELDDAVAYALNLEGAP